MNQDQVNDEAVKSAVQSDAQQQQQQEDEINNELLKKDLRNNLNDRFKQLVLKDGYQIITTREGFGKFIYLCGFIIAELYIGAVLFDNITRYLQYPDSEILIKGTVPWGVFYIILTIPVVIIQGAGCKSLKNQEEQFKSLIQDYKYLFGQNHYLNNQGDLDNFSDSSFIYTNFLGQIINANFVVILIILQFFAHSFWMALLNLVLIDWLTTLPQKLLTQVFYFLYNFDYLIKYEQHKIQNWIYEYSQIGIYRFFFEIPKYNNNIGQQQQQNIQQLNQNNELGNLQQLEGDLQKRLEILYQELEREPGYQISIIQPPLTTFFRIFWILMTLGFITLCFISEIYLPIQQLEGISKLDSYLYVLLTIPIILIQGPGFKLFNSKERQYNILAKDYQKIRNKLGLNQYDFPWSHSRLINLRNYKIIQEIILCLALLGLQYFSKSITQALFNCLIIEFIGQFEDIAMNNMYLNLTSLQYLLDSFDYGIYLYQIIPHNCKYPSAYQTYSQLWELDINLQELQGNSIQNVPLCRLLIKRLKQQFLQIFQKSQMKFAFISLSISLYCCLFWMFVSILFVTLMDYTIINYWLTLSSEYIWINNSHFPWGVLYLILIIPIIIIQGVGLREVDNELRCYRKLKKDYVQFEADEQKFQWNDQNYEMIETLFIFQTCLIGFLLIPAIYTSPNCQIMLLTLIAVQYTFTFNKNAQGNLCFNWTNFKELRMNWRSYEKVLTTNVWSFKSMYRFYWNINN